MISVLYSLVFAEMAVIVALLFRTPLRRLMIIGMDQMKRGKGPLVAKTVAATLLVVFGGVLYSVMQIRRRLVGSGIVINSTDEILMAQRLLEASLMGFCLFLAMMTDRLHYCIKELYIAREQLKRSKHDEKPKVKEIETVSKRKTKEAKFPVSA
ncbi:uncharacterized protein LOC126667650 [Mercurialis annua]|uniref:uncharacterized protein LOC126667650 n=1 Tax=Mercurialis annua TaxID=3986 RepID=UPI00215E26A6|nr:uncharacterized protein LOC126667650 [Mercurialis annua]